MILAGLFFMIELDQFYNNGFGWICRQCERELHATGPADKSTSRLMREGEAESKQPTLSSSALAKWIDPSHRTLICPRCSITELVDKA
jgi:hypothetical protein